MRITPDVLWGQGYGGFVDTWQLPEVVAHKKKQDAAWSDYQKATDYALGYLGGRTSGTTAEKAEAMRRYAASDAASSKHRALSDQMNTIHDRALGNWASQYGIAYNADRARGENPWSWIGGKDPLAMADPLPPPDKDTRQKPNPNQKPSSPYEPYKSPFKLAGGNVPYVSDDSDLPYNFDGSGDWADDDDLQKKIDSLIDPATGGFKKAQNNKDMQIARLDHLGGYGAAALGAGLIIEGTKAGKKLIENFSNQLRNQRTNQNEQSRTGGSQTREQAATTAAGSQGTRDKKRYSNLRIRTGGNNTDQLNTGILV